MKTLNQNIKLKATKGKETIVRADDVFTRYIDSDFENYGTDKKGVATEDMEMAVLEQDKNGTLKEIFVSIHKDLDSMVMTQEQIITFCKDHKELLHPTWYTFFLFKSNNEFFVARVYVSSGGLGVCVYRFSRDSVWFADRRRRFVVPQLALSDSESLAPRPFDSLTLENAIKIVKENGYKVIKEF